VYLRQQVDFPEISTSVTTDAVDVQYIRNWIARNVQNMNYQAGQL
jgi:hypothetical protein